MTFYAHTPLLLLAAVLAPSIAAVLLVRRRTGAIEAGAAAGFATALYGMLLGLMLYSANGHFDSARRAAQAEARAATALMLSVDGLPRDQQIAVNHDAMCVMRAVVDTEWSMMTRDPSGSPKARDALLRLNATVAGLDVTNPAIGSRATEIRRRTLDLMTTRDTRLAEAYESTLQPLWVVIFLGAAVVTIVTGLSAKEGGRRWVLAMAPPLVLLTVVVWVLAAVDKPYDGVLVRVEPTAMQEAMATVVAIQPDPRITAPCP